jgi:hypothetical protein
MPPLLHAITTTRPLTRSPTPLTTSTAAKFATPPPTHAGLRRPGMPPVLHHVAAGLRRAGDAARPPPRRSRPLPCRGRRRASTAAGSCTAMGGGGHRRVVGGGDGAPAGPEAIAHGEDRRRRAWGGATAAHPCVMEEGVAYASSGSCACTTVFWTLECRPGGMETREWLSSSGREAGAARGTAYGSRRRGGWGVAKLDLSPT